MGRASQTTIKSSDFAAFYFSSGNTRTSFFISESHKGQEGLSVNEKEFRIHPVQSSFKHDQTSVSISGIGSCCLREKTKFFSPLILLINSIPHYLFLCELPSWIDYSSFSS